MLILAQQIILDLSVFQSYLLRKTPSFLSYFFTIFYNFFEFSKFKTKNTEISFLGNQRKRKIFRNFAEIVNPGPWRPVVFLVLPWMDVVHAPMHDGAMAMGRFRSFCGGLRNSLNYSIIYFKPQFILLLIFKNINYFDVKLVLSTSPETYSGDFDIAVVIMIFL